MTNRKPRKYNMIKENKLFFILLFSFSAIIIIDLLLPYKLEYKDLSSQLDALNQIEVDTSTLDYGIAFLIRDYKGDTYTKSYGYASHNTKMTADKIFNIASTTKTFTAVLILQEMEKGTLQLEDEIGAFFNPSILEKQNINPNVTIKELLNHQSGLTDIIFKSDSIYDYKKFDFREDKFNKPRGEHYYSNFNYSILGQILEIINDKSFEEILQERILTPYNLKNTYNYYSKAIPNIAHPMNYGKDLLDIIDGSHFNEAMQAAASISSNINDLAIFFTHLYAGDFFKRKKTLRLMMKYNENSGYGLGLRITAIEDEILYYGHPGDYDGFTSRNFYSPQTGQLLIVLVNESEENAEEYSKLKKDLLRIISQYEGTIIED